jgi:SAM-dependent methyltransferase
MYFICESEYLYIIDIKKYDSMVVKAIRKIANFFGFDTHSFLFRIFEVNTQILLDKKISLLSPELQKLVIEEDEKMHYGDSELIELASQNVVRSFSIDRIQFIQECVGKQKIPTVVDLGDSNGLFIRSVNARGISVNISEQTARYLKKKGLEVVRADVEHLPFKNNSIDVMFFFQTLEHVKNPVSVLEETGRVCKKSLILSIPFVNETHINRYHFDDGKPFYQHHIFEFNPADFKNILKLTPFSMKLEKKAVVIDSRVSPLFHRMVFFFWNTFIDNDTYCSCFKKFYMCHLVKKGEDNAIPMRKDETPPENKPVVYK